MSIHGGILPQVNTAAARRPRKAVGLVPVRPQAQERPAPRKASHRLGQAVSAAAAKRGARRRTRWRSPPRFRPEQAAGGIDQAPTGLGQPRGAGQDGRVALACSSATAWGDWRHFRSGLRRRVPRPSRRVHQHPVHLAGQALDAVVTLMGDLGRVDVRQPAARQPGLQGRRAGGPTRRRRRAARCCAWRRWRASCRRPLRKVRHHLAALGASKATSNWLPRPALPRRRR